MYIDTHCHLDSKDYDNVEDVIKRVENNILIVSGVDDRTNKEVIALCNKYKNIYGTIGLHPSEIHDNYEETLKFVENNMSNPKIVGIGEIGLDYHYDNVDKNLQRKVFQKQIELVKKYNKTIVIHSRDAAQDTLDILKKSSITNNKVVMHCYSYSKEMAYEFIKMNIKLGIGGVLTFKNAHKLKDIVEELSLNNFLLETDSPYLTPEPHRGEKNEPCNVIYVAKKIAELKNLPLDEVLEVTTSNAICQFDLKLDL